MIRGITQEEIARRMGSHQSNVSSWLSGRRIPTRRNLVLLAEAMETTPENLAAILYRKHMERLGQP
jgi:transcriptional regulator with XRE-family HTH domain